MVPRNSTAGVSQQGGGVADQYDRHIDRGRPPCSFQVVVVLTLTHNTMQSVVAGQAPLTHGWKKYHCKKLNEQRIVHMITEAHLHLRRNIKMVILV